MKKFILTISMTCIAIGQPLFAEKVETTTQQPISITLYEESEPLAQCSEERAYSCGTQSKGFNWLGAGLLAGAIGGAVAIAVTSHSTSN